MPYLRTRDRVYACLRRQIREEGRVPSLREIACEVGLSSPGSVARHLAELEQRGKIRRRHGGERSLPRSIELPHEPGCCRACGRTYDEEPR